MQTHAACTRLPFRARIAAAQTSQLLPRLAAIFRFKERGIFNAGINMVGIVERRFQVPDALELPRMLGSIVPLVRGYRLTRLGRCVVNKLVRSEERRVGKECRSG